MTCENALELLPWLLNGTLEDEERAEVRRHLETCAPCREALAETRNAGAIFAQHIAGADLVSLAWGERPSGIDPALAEAHLASCPQCAAELELVRMSRRLEEEDNVAVFPAVKRRPETGAAPQPWRRAAIAAGLAAVVASAGWFQAAQRPSAPPPAVQAEAPAVPPTGAADGSSQRQEVARLEDQLRQLIGLQQANDKKVADAQAQVAQLEKERQSLARPQPAPMFDLGSGDVVRGEEPKELKRVPAHQAGVLFFPARGDGERRAEIQDESGKVVWQATLPVTDGYHSLTLPAGSLPPGRYTIRIAGRDESWNFQVVP